MILIEAPPHLNEPVLNIVDYIIAPQAHIDRIQIHVAKHEVALELRIRLLPALALLGMADAKQDANEVNPDAFCEPADLHDASEREVFLVQLRTDNFPPVPIIHCGSSFLTRFSALQSH